MVTKSAPKQSQRHRSATIQWIAIGIIAVLGMLAAFVFWGDDSTVGGGHSGLSTIETGSVAVG